MGNLPSDTTLTVRLPETLKKWAQSLADDRGISLSEVVKRAIYAYVDLYTDPMADSKDHKLMDHMEERWSNETPLTLSEWGEVFSDFFDNVLAEQEQAPF